MNNTYVVEGGIGKCTAFTALIPKLAKRDGQEIQVWTPYVDCFGGNPNIKMAYEQTIPLTDARILASDNILYCEPYKSNFAKGNQHIIESYCELLGIEYESNMVPKMYTGHIKERADAWIKQAELDGKKFIMLQLSGGQTPIGWNQQNQYNSIDPGRNYPYYLGQQLVYMLREALPDVAIVNTTLPNEPGYDQTVQYVEHFAVIHEVMKQSSGFIGIDSCMNHFSASTGISGVVIWGSTRWINFGYDHNVNVQFHMGKRWDANKYNPQDPRNPMVDPKTIVDKFLIQMKQNSPNQMKDKIVRCLTT